MRRARLGLTPWRAREWMAVARALIDRRDRSDSLAAALAHIGYGAELHLLNRGSTALHIALQTMRQLRPDRRTVVIPAYCCPSVPHVVAGLGLEGVAAPVGDDLNLDLDQLSAYVDSDTLAVIGVHMYGLPLDMARLRAIAHAAGAFAIDDAAHLLVPQGATRTGRAGDVGLLSFNQSKTLTGGAPNGGGALIVSSDALRAPIADAVAQLPRGRNRWRNLLWFALAYGFEPLPRPLVDYLASRLPGLKGWCGVDDRLRERLSPTAGAAVLAQLPRLDAIWRTRQRLFDAYRAAVRAHPHLRLVQDRPGACPTRILLAWDTERPASDVMAALKAEGIACNLPYPDWSTLAGAPFRRMLRLPASSRLTDADVAAIVDRLAHHATAA